MNSHVKFIDYSGSYPCLCMGELMLDIDGETVTFSSHDCTDFWTTGGSCGFYGDYEEEYVNRGPWLFDEERLPEKYRKYADEIFECFNANVPEGCCGGCL